MSRLLAMLLPALLAPGCVEVSGGAVEARWDLRDPDGHRIQRCAATPITTLRFALIPLQAGTDPCATDPTCRFDCELKTGTTRFVIPVGDYVMALEALGSAGETLGPPGVVVPEPVTRRIVTGQLTDLSVNLIIVTP